MPAQATPVRPTGRRTRSVDQPLEPEVSRAYCLTCNEQVHETVGGTCPLGHPVTAPDHGPEPWVGFATPTTTAWDTAVDDHDVPMERLGMDGRPVAHAGVNGHAGINGHATANGHANGSVNGHAVGGGHGRGEDPDGADDLAALLAEALHGAEAAEPEVEEPEPETPRPGDPADASTEDWDDLASLAAELQLDADHGVDDGPTAA